MFIFSAKATNLMFKFSRNRKKRGGHSLHSWKNMNKKVKVEWVTQLEHVRHSEISTTNGKKSTKLLYL